MGIFTYSFNSAKDLFAKMQRDAEVLEKCVTGDAAFNFVITAYHIRDWVKESIESIKNIGEAGQNLDLDLAKKDLELLFKSEYFRLCRDLANASKHMNITRKDLTMTDVTSNQGFGVGRFGKGPFGVGEESIRVTSSSGEEVDILKLKDEVLELWSIYFRKHDL